MGGADMKKAAILVTGGAGFIGCNLVRRLCLSSRYHVINLDKLTYAGNLESLVDLMDHPCHTFVRGDISDRELVKSLLNKHQPLAVFNLAAESHVDRSIVSGIDFLKTNVLGTYNLLEEARSYWDSLDKTGKSAFRFIHISTDEVYGSLGEQGKFTEQSRIQPNSPYSASKASSDHFVRAFFHTYGLPTITTNCSNNYGPYQFPEKMIPLMINYAIEAKPLPVYGDGGNVRDWIHVSDHCAALEVILKKNQPGEVFNIGGDSEWKNIDVVRAICEILEELFPVRKNPEMIAKAIGKYSDLITFVPDRPGHDRRYAIDSSKISSQLGWKPKFTFPEGLHQTVEWYLEHRKWVDHVRSGEYQHWMDPSETRRLEEKG